MGSKECRNVASPPQSTSEAMRCSVTPLSVAYRGLATCSLWWLVDGELGALPNRLVEAHVQQESR
jgi:hypothetical protein